MKLHNLTITDFRSFDRFTLNNLGRVNLLVGTNNSGKTTVLEAAFVLRSQGLWSVEQILQRRGEVFPHQANASPPRPPRVSSPTCVICFPVTSWSMTERLSYAASRMRDPWS